MCTYDAVKSIHVGVMNLSPWEVQSKIYISWKRRLQSIWEVRMGRSHNYIKQVRNNYFCWGKKCEMLQGCSTSTVSHLNLNNCENKIICGLKIYVTVHSRKYAIAPCCSHRYKLVSSDNYEKNWSNSIVVLKSQESDGVDD